MRLPSAWDESLLRIAQESLTNTIHHAHATRFLADLFFCTDEIQLQLYDNGMGFDVTAPHAGFGLLGIRERVEEMGGTLAIKSTESERNDRFRSPSDRGRTTHRPGP